jgi:transcriptional antiterminator NusG
MDIHDENEEQMHEIEPLASDPQLSPEPEPVKEEAEVVKAEVEDLVMDQKLEEEEQDAEAEAEADPGTDDSTAPQPSSPEILEELPAMEPEPEQELDAEDEVAPEPEPEPEMEAEAVQVEDPVDPIELSEEEQNKYAAVEKEILSEGEELDIDPYGIAAGVSDPVAEDGRAWYVIHCYSGNEDKVRHNIMQRIESMSMDTLIFDVVVPTEDEVNIKNGERQTVEKKVFPGYILVYMILTEESWYMVRNTPGVTGFVGMGNDPTALQPEEVARILKRMESESPRINVTFRPGERVRIVDGPFEDFYGKVSEIDMERATVRVMVNFFGRETPVELDFLQVEEA